MKPKIKNWLKLIESGELKNKSVRVLHFLMNNPLTDLDQVRTTLQMPHQTCSAVISNLMDCGMIKGVGERTKNGLHYSQLVVVESEQERDILAYKREQEKFMVWINRGLDDYQKYLSPIVIQELRKVLDNKGSTQQINLF